MSYPCKGYWVTYKETYEKTYFVGPDEASDLDEAKQNVLTGIREGTLQGPDSCVDSKIFAAKDE